MSNINKLNEQLKRNILPVELQFDTKTPFSVDLEKVRYNTYKDPEYYERRFPQGFHSLPGFEQILNKIASNVKTPLEEIEERG
jgi:hypothetical protein